MPAALNVYKDRAADISSPLLAGGLSWRQGLAGAGCTGRAELSRDDGTKHCRVATCENEWFQAYSQQSASLFLTGLVGLAQVLGSHWCFLKRSLTVLTKHGFTLRGCVFVCFPAGGGERARGMNKKQQTLLMLTFLFAQTLVLDFRVHRLAGRLCLKTRVRKLTAINEGTSG